MTGAGLEARLEGRTGGLRLDVDLDVAGTPTVIVGPNGSGKTTLLLAILGALRPERGRVQLDGAVLYDADLRVDVPVEARRIAFVPQRYALFPHLTVLANVAYGARGKSGRERRQAAARLMDELGLGALAARRPGELSGGEAQRVALARALAGTPRALLLDEPLAALDASLREETRRLLAARVATLGIPTVIVTHDGADARAFGGPVVVLEGGRVTQRGTLDEIAARPATAYVRDLVRAPGAASPTRGVSP
jgi:molybdate transport system ATP-binding protein